MKVVSKRGTNVRASAPSSNQAYGKANRPTTPVQDLIANSFGEMSEANLQAQYA